MNILQYKGYGEICLFKDDELVLKEAFYDSDEALLQGLKAALENSIPSIRFEGFSPYITNKINTHYRNSFSNKFKYATKAPEEFIDIMLKEFDAQKSFNDKLTALLSPFHRIEHGDALTINVILQSDNVDQNVKTNSFKFNTENFNKPAVSFFTDASVTNDAYMAGYGVSGKDIMVSFRFNEPIQDSNLAELKAIKQAILVAKEMELPSLEVFTDSNQSINFLNLFNVKNRELNQKYKEIISEIVEELSYFESYQIAWIPRTKNKFADHMSKENFPYLANLNRILVS